MNLGVHEIHSRLSYWSFSESAVNTFDQETAERAISRGSKLESKKEVEVRPLADILDEYLPGSQLISFLSIDVEGVDIHVLKSNNWTTYRPKVLLVEINDLLICDYKKNEIVTYLSKVGYLPYGKTVNNWVFVDGEQFVKKLHSDQWWSDE